MMRYVKSKRCTILFVSLLSVFMLSIQTYKPSKAQGEGPPDISGYAYQVIQLINQLRAANGVPALSPHPILMQLSQAHADYQAAAETITHFSADGLRPFQRALAAGYWVAGDLSQNGFFSENIAAGPDLTPARVVQAWQGDDPHLNTMISPNYRDIGVGVSTDGLSIYYTVDCAKASNVPVPYTPEARVESSAGSGYIVPVKKADARADGSIYHEVKSGQTMWAIAIAYGTTIREIAALNGRLGSEQTYMGESLLVRPAFTLTPILPTSTRTPRPASSTATPVASTEAKDTMEEPEEKLGLAAAIPVVLVALVILVGIIRMGLKPPPPSDPYI